MNKQEASNWLNDELSCKINRNNFVNIIYAIMDTKLICFNMSTIKMCYIHGLMQERRNSSALAMELHLDILNSF